MKNTLCLFLVAISIFFIACTVDPVERDAERLVKVACEGERETNIERKKEFIEEYRKLDKEMKRKYKDNIPDGIRLADLYFKKLKDCLGYIPVR